MSKFLCTFAAAKVYITPRRLHDVKQQGQAQVCATYLIIRVCDLLDPWNVFSDKEVLDHTEAYKVTIVPRYPLEKDMKVGNWLSKIYMGIY